MMDTPEAIYDIKPTESHSSTEMMRNFIEGTGLNMLSNDYFGEIFRVKAHVEGANWLLGVGLERYPLSQLGDWSDVS